MTGPYLDTSTIKNMHSLFGSTSEAAVSHFINIDLSYLDTSNVTNMGYMFNNCSKLESLDVSRFNTQNVTEMDYMFWNCSSLITIDVSKWNMSKVEDVQHMFERCEALEYIDTSKWDMTKVELANSMFNLCSKLNYLDVSNWSMSKARYVNYMFAYCSKLTDLNVSNWDISPILDTQRMFYNCSKIKSLDLSKWDLSGVTSMSHMFENCMLLESITFSDYDFEPKDIHSMFSNCYYLKTIDLSTWYLGSVWDAEELFLNCYRLESVLLPVNTTLSNNYSDTVTTDMFKGCYNLKYVDMSGLNWVCSPGNNNDTYMFAECSNLETVNLSNIVFKSSVAHMFEDCTSLENVICDENAFAQVYEFSYMFYCCSSLKRIPDCVYNKNENSINTEYMFGNCTSLYDANLYSMITSDSVTDNKFANILCNAESLQFLNLSNVTVSKRNSYGYALDTNHEKRIKAGGSDKTESSEFVEIIAPIITDNAELKIYETMYDENGNSYRILSSATSGKILTSFQRTSNTVTTVHGNTRDLADAVNAYTAYGSQSCIVFSDGDYALIGTATSTEAGWKFDEDTRIHKKLCTYNGKTYCSCDAIDYYQDMGAVDIYIFDDGFCYMGGSKTTGEVSGNTTNTSTKWAIETRCKVLYADLKFTHGSQRYSYNGDIYGLFQNKSTITTFVTGDNFDATSLANMYGMFNGCTSLTSIDLSKFDKAKNLTSMSGAFLNCSSLTSIDVSKINTSKVYDFNAIFQGCSKLTSIDISNWVINPNATGNSFKSANGIFCGCSSLTTLKLPTTADFTNVAGIRNMFNGCTSLTSLDLSGWKTSGVPDMSTMFYNCEKLTSIKFGSGWDTSSCTTLGSTFRGCKSLTSLDLSNWNTSKVTAMSYLFHGCEKLTSIKFGSGWDTSSVTDMSALFWGCKSITSLDLSTWNTSNVTNMYTMFCYDEALTTVNVSTWDVSKVTTMKWMFAECYKLTSLDLSNWKTSSLTDMYGIFTNDKVITSIKFGSGWDTSKVTTMAYTFYNCYKLTSLDLSSWNTSANESMLCMFKNCNVLTTLKLGSNWSTANVTNMDSTFLECNALTSLDVSKWDVSKVTNMSNLFNGCKKVSTLDVSNWDVSKVTSICWLFNNCNTITTLDLSKWNTAALVKASPGWFGNCTSLTSVKLGPNVNWSNLTDVHKMFYNCSALKTLDLSNVVIPSGADVTDFFAYCNALETLVTPKSVGASLALPKTMYNASTHYTKYTMVGQGDAGITLTGTILKSTYSVSVPATVTLSVDSNKKGTASYTLGTTVTTVNDTCKVTMNLSPSKLKDQSGNEKTMSLSALSWEFQPSTLSNYKKATGDSYSGSKQINVTVNGVTAGTWEGTVTCTFAMSE
jgi:surface protein